MKSLSIWTAALVFTVLSPCEGADALRFDFSPSPLARVLQRVARATGALDCPRSAAPPKIDGKLDDAAWRRAAAIDGFVSASGARGAPNTRVRVCFDARALYLAVECDRKPDATPARPRDGAVWKDDCIEVWIDPAGRGRRVYQFIVSAAGSIYDSRGTGGSSDASYDPEWQQAVVVGEEGWRVEIAIPKKAVERKQWPARMGFNIGRNGPKLQTQAWARDYGDTTRMRLVMQGAAAAAAKEEPQARAADRPLTLTLDRPFARPGERWIEAKVGLGAGGPARLRASVWAIGAAEPSAETTVVPTREEGALLIDLRSLGLKKARLCVELTRGGRQAAAEEAFISAREPEERLEPGQRLPVKIRQLDGLAPGDSWPVVFGAPFAEGVLWDAERLRLVDGKGREIPCQKEVVGRWAKDGAIKWVRFDAVVSPQAGCFVEAAPAQAAPATPVRVVEKGGKIVLDTGRARYVLAKGPSPIEEVWLAGQRVAAAAGSRGLYVVDQKGRTASASADGESVQIEARGPLAACVRFEGFYRTPEGEPLARHITRVEAFAGQAFAKVTHTLVLTRDTNEVWFRNIGWEFAVEPGRDSAAIFGVSRADPSKATRVSLARADSVATMLQDRHYRFGLGENHFRVSADAKTTLEGEECGDWAALAGGDAAFVFACKEAARQHPKEFEVRPNRIVLHLFSNRGGEELDFRVPALIKRWNLANWYEHVLPERYKNQGQVEKVGKYRTNAIGWAKTHELVFAALPPEGVEARASRLARLNRRAVLALADPQWIYKTKVINNGIHPRDAERFARAEQLIAATFDVWERRIGDWGEFGFVDYFAGPHLGYKGKYPIVKRYCPYTYTLRGDMWIAFARSADWRMGEFAAATNKAYLDNVMCHYDGAGKIAGLFIAQPGGDTPRGDSKHSLPFYWDGIPIPNVSSSSDLDNFIRLYTLTGYRRAKDLVLEYASGMKRYWTPAKARRDWRGIMTMRLLAQAYAVTWDPELRAIAAATTDAFVDWEGELGLTKNRPYRSTSYKTQVDIAGLLDAWRIFGEPRYYDLARRISKFWWKALLGKWPMFYTNPQGRIGQFLYNETGDPSYVQGLAVQMRQAATAYDPATGRARANRDGRIGAHESTFVFQGIGYAQDLIARYGADKLPATSWAGIEDFGYPATILAFKRDDESIEIDFKTASEGVGVAGGVRVRPIAPGTSAGANLTRIVQFSDGVATVRVPKDAPEGAYEIAPARPGTHFALCHSHAPLVVYAPEFWRPSPSQAPAVRWYFKVPKAAEAAQILFEAPTKLYAPDGRPWPDDAAQQGWVNLPGDKPGLWSFAAVENGIVAVRNLPPFFAAEDPKHYFEPKIPWKRVPPAVPFQKPPASVVFVPGAIDRPGNQALSLTGPRRFYLPAGPDHPSGDGGMFVPFRQGTIEFFIRPYWSTYDLPSPSYLTLVRCAARYPWTLTYSKDLTKKLWMLSHVLYGSFYTDGPKKRITMRAYRRTVFEAGKWAHVAWVWGTRWQPSFKTGKPVQVLTARLFVDGRAGQGFSYRWEGHQPADRPTLFYLLGSTINAAYDELRLSDVQRYLSDFTPPARDREFELDAHTRALFHFNGNIDGLSYGHAGPLPARFKNP